MYQPLNLIAVTGIYPSDVNPQQGAFVHVLMRDLYALGARPTVLAPEKVVSLASWRKGWKLAPPVETRDGVEIRRPRYLPFSNRVLPGGWSIYPWTVASFGRAVLRNARSIVMQPHLCYGHFLYPGGVSAQQLAQRLGVASAVALGESSFDSYEVHFGLERVHRDLARFSRIIVVSETIKERCVLRYGVPEERVGVFPNAAAPLFYPRPREEMRRKLGLPLDRPIIIFVGHFDHNKGPHRVLEAIQSRPDIGVIFLGRGPLKPTGSQVLFSGLVPHEQVPGWLNAADVYVHPALVEASSNALKEAMACGLPVVASNIATNREFLDPAFALLVDPIDIGQIRGAIEDLIDHPEKREAMSAAALEKARGFRSRDRARRILNWLEELRNNPCVY